MKRIYTILSVAVCSAALASEVTWTGAVNMTWDTSTANWQDADGVACCFTSGDDVVFGPSSGDRTVNVPYGSKWTVGTMVVDSDALVNVSGHIVGMDRVVKRGTGRLTFAGDQSTWEGDIDVEEGELYLEGYDGSLQTAADYVDPVKGHLGNGQAERTITIGPKGRLFVRYSWPLGGPLSTPNVTMNIQGTMENFYLPSGSGWGHAGFAFGDLVLNSTNFFMNGEDLKYVSNLPARNWNSFAWNGDVWFNTPDVFTLEGRGSFYIGTGSRMPTLYVPDRTGDDASDVILKKSIVDTPAMIPVNEGGVNTHYAYPNGVPSRFVKDGAGTLELWSDTSSMTGDIVVKGGTLRVTRGGGGTVRTYGALGNPHADRSIVLLDGTVLEVRARQTMGTVYSDHQVTFAVTNATVRLAREGGQLCAINFGNLDFYNARIEYEGNGHNVEGYFNVGARARIDGTEPCVFRSTGGYNNILLGYGLDKVEEVEDPAGTGAFSQMSATYTGCTEFDIRDITGDGAADLIVEAVLRDVPGTGDYAGDIRYRDNNETPKRRTFHCGLKKVGPGSMLLKNNSNPYTGVTVVKEGALLVDGKIENSPVTVKAGGLIGGRGTVPSLEVQEGGGFVVNCTNGMAQVSVTGAYTLPEVGVLWLTGYEGAVESVRGVRAFSIAGADNAEAVNASAWTVRMDGYSAKDTRDVEVERDGDMLVVTYRLKGTTILVR